MIGKASWLTDPRFTSTVTRERNWAELMALIEDWTRQHTAGDCERQLMAAGVPCTRYLSVQQAMQSDQVRARGATTTVRDAAGEYQVPNAPFRMPGVQAAPRPHVPALGEHTASVLQRLAGETPVPALAH